MSYVIISEQVDIYYRPQLVEKYSEVGGEITIGDLHANAIKLIYVLIKHGVITNISDAQYAELVEIYLTPVDKLNVVLDRFEEILRQVTFKPTVLVRFLGDFCCDRGTNEDFVFTVIKIMSENNVNHEELWGNHDAEFIEITELTKEADDFLPPRMKDRVVSSMINFWTLMNVHDRIDRYDRILEIAETAYKPNLKAISYTLDKELNTIVLYSHAAIDLSCIKILASKLQVPYLDEKASELALTIDLINNAFAIYVHEKKVHTLYSHDVMLNAYRSVRPNKQTDIFEFLAWNRCYDAVINRVPEYKRYNIHYVHGHDSSDPNDGLRHITNLDNEFGKYKEGPPVGEYRVLYTIPNTFEKRLAISSVGNDQVINMPVSQKKMQYIEEIILEPCTPPEQDYPSTPPLFASDEPVILCGSQHEIHIHDSPPFFQEKSRDDDEIVDVVSFYKPKRVRKSTNNKEDSSKELVIYSTL